MAEMEQDNTHIQFGKDIIERTITKYSVRGSSTYKRRTSVQETDSESVFSEKDTGVREIDYKKRQVSNPPVDRRDRCLRIIL